MIRGERVTLRAVEREDASAIHRWFNNPDVMRFWGVPTPVVSLVSVQRQIEEWLEAEGRLDRPVCLVIEAENAEPVGLMILSNEQPRHRSVELSMLIGEPIQWGQGLGTDALQTLLDVCFDSWNLHRVWVRSEADNERAHRLYRRLGFTLEGTLREATFVNGAYQNVLIFSILEGDSPDDRRPSPGSA
jgi:RimJ/RimL family protein N-acetyltransferase